MGIQRQWLLPITAGRLEETPESKLNRRQFIAAVGAAAASSALFRETMKADTSTQYYYNSFGDVVPADPTLIELGIPVPPLPPGVYPPENQGTDTAPFRPMRARGAGRLHLDDNPPAGNNNTYVTANYAAPNILMIMVDQLRYPRWAPSTSSNNVNAFDSLMPNIAALRNHSLWFSNYCVAATMCTPSRATLLTGLYAQQTAIFKTQSNVNQPNLQTTYPNIATVLNPQVNQIQNLNYNCYWMGKWHLSDFEPGSATIGGNGPVDYGFTDWIGYYGVANLPGNNTQAAPNGLPNEGTRGDNPNGVPPAQTFSPPYYAPHTSPLTWSEYNDAFIADHFVNTFLPSLGSNTSAKTNWFAAVSFVNPHDIAFFPYYFGQSLPVGSGNNFTYPGNAFNSSNGMPYASYTGANGYQPPPTAGYTNSDPGNYTIPALNTSFYTPSNLPTNWNVYDPPSPYNNGRGKPDAQTDYMDYITYRVGNTSGLNMSDGSQSNPNAWTEFLNYYLWMQSCVDFHVGRVITALGTTQINPPTNNNTYWPSTVIIFLSDHGEYAGSHWLSGKGSTGYEESINVPLFISYPGQRGSYAAYNNGTSSNNYYQSNYLCSSVDILPLLYALGLGNDLSWRNNSSDVINYLKHRESIFDVINGFYFQRRQVQIDGVYTPYVLHTSDDIVAGHPAHVVALRAMNNNSSTAGGKLVQYGSWPNLTGSYSGTNNTTGFASNYTYPQSWNGTPEDNSQEFEYYTYPDNPGELGNDFATEFASANNYYAALTSANVNAELYAIPGQISSQYSAAFQRYWQYVEYYQGGSQGGQAVTDADDALLL